MAGNWGSGSVSDTFVKLPSRDVIDFNAAAKTPEELSMLFIQEIGGVELSQLTNYQTVYGTNPKYVSVSDLLNVTAEYNPADWLLNKLPTRGTEQAIDYNSYFESVAITDTGIEINFSMLPPEFDVEVQIDSNAIIDIQETT